MFGLTMEKLIVIGIVAALILGPHRLPLYAEKLAALVRGIRDVTQTAKVRAENELGIPLNTTEWSSHIQQYDPRRIIREALAHDQTALPKPEQMLDEEGHPGDPAGEFLEEPGLHRESLAAQEQWVVVGGSSGHPVRRRVHGLEADGSPLAEKSAI